MRTLRRTSTSAKGDSRLRRVTTVTGNIHAIFHPVLLALRVLQSIGDTACTLLALHNQVMVQFLRGRMHGITVTFRWTRRRWDFVFQGRYEPCLMLLGVRCNGNRYVYSETPRCCPVPSWARDRSDRQGKGRLVPWRSPLYGQTAPLGLIHMSRLRDDF